MSSETVVKILDELSIDNFIRRHPKCTDYETDAVLFFSYSLNFKSVLAGLCSVYLKSGEIKDYRTYGKKLDRLLEKFSRKLSGDQGEQTINTILMYNNGNGDFTDCTASDLVQKLAAPVTMPDGSFHPKLYICKYVRAGAGEEAAPVYYRFVIGSENLSSYKETVLEHGISFEVKVDPAEVNPGDGSPTGKMSTGQTESTDNGERWRNFWNQVSKIIDSCLDGEDTIQNAERVWQRLAFPFGENESVAVDHFPEIWLSCPEQNTDSDKNTSCFDFLFDFVDQPRSEKLLEVHTPFLGEDNSLLQKLCGQNAIVYTNAEELEKAQAVRLDDEPQAKPEQIFRARCLELLKENKKENKKYLSAHYKGYVTCDTKDNGKKYLYTGSLNYTAAAFYKNVEILVKVPGACDDFEKYKDYCEYHYKGKQGYYPYVLKQKDSKDGTPQSRSPEDIFKKAVKKALFVEGEDKKKRPVRMSVQYLPKEKGGGVVYEMQLGDCRALEELLKHKSPEYRICVRMTQKSVDLTLAGLQADGGRCKICFPGESVRKILPFLAVRFQLLEQAQDQEESRGAEGSLYNGKSWRIVCQCAYQLKTETGNLEQQGSTKDPTPGQTSLKDLIEIMREKLQISSEDAQVFQESEEADYVSGDTRQRAMKDVNLEELLLGGANLTVVSIESMERILKSRMKRGKFAKEYGNEEDRDYAQRILSYHIEDQLAQLKALKNDLQQSEKGMD